MGPASVPSVQRSLVRRGVHLTVSRSGDAARYAVIERTDPLGPAAIDRVRELRRDLPALARAAGLTGVRVETGGETALVGEAVDAAVSDLSRVALVIGLVILVLLAVFLWSAPEAGRGGRRAAAGSPAAEDLQRSGRAPGLARPP